MKRTAVIAIGILSTVLLVYLLYNQQNTATGPARLTNLFPDLESRINEVAQISISTNETKVQVVLKDGEWKVEDHNFYPANFDVVRNFLLGINQLRILAEKTSDPTKFSVLELVGTDVEGSQTIEVTLRSLLGDQLASLLIGKQQVSKKNALLTEFFVRKPAEQQTYLVESSLDVATESLDWLNDTIIDLQLERTLEVETIAAGGVSVRVFKQSAESKNFDLADMPDGYQVSKQFAVNDLGKLFKSLRFETVVPVEDWKSATDVIVRTHDGLIVTAKIGVGELREFAVLTAEFNEDASEQVKLEAQKLNETWQNWAYKLTSTRHKIIATQMDEIIEPEPGS